MRLSRVGFGQIVKAKQMPVTFGQIWPNFGKANKTYGVVWNVLKVELGWAWNVLQVCIASDGVGEMLQTYTIASITTIFKC